MSFASSFCFAGNRSFASRPLVRSDPAIPTYISLIVGVIASAAVMLALGQYSALFSASFFIVLIFSVVGVFHFAVGRQLSFTAVRNVGANLASGLISTQIVYSVLFAVLLLGEKANDGIILGAGLIMGGIVLLEGTIGAGKRGGNAKIGYIAGLGTGVIFGLTPVLIKYGLTLFKYFLTATFLAFASGLIFYALVIPPRRVKSGMKLLSRSAISYYIAAGIFGVGAQLTRFFALSIAPLVIVAPILASHPIFTIVLTRKVAREFELFSLRTVSAIVIVVLGAVLVSLSSGISI